jgi:ankyrin repeat protein
MVDVNVDYMGRATFIYGAAYGGRLARLIELIGPLQDSNSAEELVLTAAQKNYLQYVDYQTDSQGNHTPLFLACYGGANVETVDFLIKKGASAYAVDNIGRMPIHLAANSADPAILRRLLEVPNMAIYVDFAAPETGQSPLHALCLPGSGAGPTAKSTNANQVACLNVLLDNSLEPLKSLMAEDKNGFTPIMLAKYYKLQPLLDVIAARFGDKIDLNSIEVQADADEKLKIDFYGRTELLEAAFCGNLASVVTEIAKDNVDVNYVNPQSDRDALQLACCTDKDGVIVRLLLPLMDPLESDQQGRTALHFACNAGSKDNVTELLTDDRVYSSINICDANGRNALHAVSMAKSNTDLPEGRDISPREELIEMLFAKGIDFDRVDANGDTALQIAEQRGNVIVAVKIKSCIEAAQQLRQAPRARLSM